MKLTDLDFAYPEELIATKPQHPPRVMWVSQENGPQEISFEKLLQNIPRGDVLVVNNTRVLKRRVFAEGLEILFLKQLEPSLWEVLFPSKKLKIGAQIQLPLGVVMTLVEKGRPQKVRLSNITGKISGEITADITAEAANELSGTTVDEEYFQKVAELPLPPYIQKAREARHTVEADESWYQTAWNKEPGSFAAPTASLHFSEQNILDLKSRGVQVLELTLHVGLGTFLPVTAEDLDDHDMHEEYVHIPNSVWTAILQAKKQGHKVWSLGTTCSRSLESAQRGLLGEPSEEGFKGFTKLLIQPGYEFQIVDCLLTNFHQPQSTLVALVAGFSSLEKVKACYEWAIERRFRLFSYGDLTVWTPKNRLENLVNTTMEMK